MKISKSVWIILMILLIGMTTACNTVQGVGRDISVTGDAIEDAADGDDDD